MRMMTQTRMKVMKSQMKRKMMTMNMMMISMKKVMNSKNRLTIKRNKTKKRKCNYLQRKSKISSTPTMPLSTNSPKKEKQSTALYA